MNGKTTVFGWTMSGFAMIIGIYMLSQWMAFQGAFRL
jgi:hypothetical protein